MGKLGNISGKEAVKAFQNAGWQQIGQIQRQRDGKADPFEFYPLAVTAKDNYDV